MALGEIFGLKRIYALGLILFTLSSLAGALAPSLAVLIAARLAQGVGTACIAAIGPAVVRDIYPRRMIGSGLGLIALSVGGTAGPTVASLILSVATRPWLFLVNVPTGMNIAWRMALCGIGFGFFQTPNNATIMTAGPQNRAGAAGGMLAVARTLGWCIGSALVTLIFSLAHGNATMLCLQVACGFALAGAIASVARGAFRSRP